MWHRRCSHRGVAETRNHIFERESALKPIAELGQVTRQMPLTDGVVGTMNRGFDVADHGVDPGKSFQGHTGRPATGDHCRVIAPGLLYRGEAAQPIGDDYTARLKMRLGPGFDLLLGDALQAAQTHGTWMPPFVGLHGGDERRFRQCTTAAFAAPALSAPIGIVELDEPAQGLGVVTFLHGLQQLVFQSPGRVVANAELALEFQCRHAALGLGQQIDGEKPGRQRQLGVGEEGAAGHRGLAMAVVALVESAITDFTVLGMTAFRACEPIRPTPTEQCLSALLLGAELREKLGQADAFPKLNLILGHVRILVVGQVQYTPEGGSKAEPRG